MRLYTFDDHRLGTLSPEGELVDVTAAVGDQINPMERMTALIENWAGLRDAVAALATSASAISLGSVTLLAPQPRPRLVVAAPVNYPLHQHEMGGEHGVYPGQTVRTIETYVGFIKASSSIIGPSEPVELPYENRRVDHEAELGVVIGRTASRVNRSDAADHVFGYVPLLDITLRGDEDRSYRKSFDTFTPIGPAIVTADEVGDPAALDLSLTVNGHVRQQANTRDMIYAVDRLVELYSNAMTLQPGDIIATGTPAGVGPIVPGDDVVLTIDKVGRLEVSVTRRQAAIHDPAPVQMAN